MKVLQYMKAAGSFCQAFFGRHDNVVAKSELGLPVLEGWNGTPEDAWLSSANLATHHTGVPRYALYCFHGSHAGEVFFLTQQTTFLGLGAQSSIVLTSADERDSAGYKIEIQPNPRLVADHGYKFSLNGRATSEAQVFDYDELELLGNRFLVMDLLNDELSKGTA